MANIQQFQSFIQEVTGDISIGAGLPSKILEGLTQEEKSLFSGVTVRYPQNLGETITVQSPAKILRVGARRYIVIEPNSMIVIPFSGCKSPENANQLTVQGTTVQISVFVFKATEKKARDGSTYLAWS